MERVPISGSKGITSKEQPTRIPEKQKETSATGKFSEKKVSALTSEEYQKLKNKAADVSLMTDDNQKKDVGDFLELAFGDSESFIIDFYNDDELFNDYFEKEDLAKEKLLLEKEIKQTERLIERIKISLKDLIIKYDLLNDKTDGSFNSDLEKILSQQNEQMKKLEKKLGIEQEKLIALEQQKEELALGPKNVLSNINKDFKVAIEELGAAVKGYRNAVMNYITATGSEKRIGELSGLMQAEAQAEAEAELEPKAEKKAENVVWSVDLKVKASSELEPAEKEVQQKIANIMEGRVLPGIEQLNEKIEQYEVEVAEGNTSDEARTILDSLKGLRTVLLSKRYGLKGQSFESLDKQTQSNQLLAYRFNVLKDSIAQEGAESHFFDPIRDKMNSKGQQALTRSSDDIKNAGNAIEQMYLYAQELKSIDSLLAVEEGVEKYKESNQIAIENWEKIKVEWSSVFLISFLVDLIISGIQDSYSKATKEAEDMRIETNKVLCDILGITGNEKTEIIKRREHIVPGKKNVIQ